MNVYILSYKTNRNNIPFTSKHTISSEQKLMIDKFLKDDESMKSFQKRTQLKPETIKNIIKETYGDTWSNIRKSNLRNNMTEKYKITLIDMLQKRYSIEKMADILNVGKEKVRQLVNIIFGMDYKTTKSNFKAISDIKKAKIVKDKIVKGKSALETAKDMNTTRKIVYKYQKIANINNPGYYKRINTIQTFDRMFNEGATLNDILKETKVSYVYLKKCLEEKYGCKYTELKRRKRDKQIPELVPEFIKQKMTMEQISEKLNINTKIFAQLIKEKFNCNFRLLKNSILKDALK